MRADFTHENAIGPGDQVADFALPDSAGRAVSLMNILNAVVTFYRGGWCPYCNIQLQAYQAILPELTALDACLVAISSQRVEGSVATSEANGLTFDVLSDVGNVVARALGFVWSLPEELRAALRSNNQALPEINGDESWELPVPATYVIARHGRVALAAVEVDYRKRLEPDAILASLRSLKSR